MKYTNSAISILTLIAGIIFLINEVKLKADFQYASFIFLFMGGFSLFVRNRFTDFIIFFMNLSLIVLFMIDFINNKHMFFNQLECTIVVISILVIIIFFARLLFKTKGNPRP
ncbi:hypothetical protein B9D94_00690 (plasmid) [Paenibacillus sp. Cedars]|nr:hypothetical protein B9D94_00690 [Paenibacillus sp. Cedars]